MNKVLCSLLVLAIIGTAQCESFKRINFDQGRIERNLDAVAAPGRSGLEGPYTNQTVVAVKILEDFLVNNTLDTKANTSLALFLHSSETGFCSSSTYFVHLDCTYSTNCKKSSDYFGVNAGKIRMQYVYQILNDTTFVTLENQTNWKLTTKPVIFSGYTYSGETPPANTTYGILGLGAQGLARNNFGADTAPVFSLKVNGTGKGSIIFGNDTGLIQTGRKDKYLTWNTTENWIGTSSALYARYSNNTEYTTRVYFDLNQVGTSLSSAHYSKAVTGFNLTYNSTGGRYNYYYNATAMGPIAKHPPVIITIGGSNVTIPIEALFKKVEDPKTPNQYTFMVESVVWEYNYNTTNNEREEITIFGTHFLSNFYTVFSAPKDVTPFVTLHPTFTGFTDSGSSSSSGGSGGKFLIGLIAVIGLGAVGFIVFRNKAASKLQEHLNEK